jgi:hypothetical protein
MIGMSFMSFVELFSSRHIRNAVQSLIPRGPDQHGVCRVWKALRW